MLEKLLPGQFPVITPGDMTGDIMKLNVLERLLVLNLLPAEGSYTNLKLMRKAKENLSFTEDENKLLNFKQDGDSLRWADNVVPDKEIDIGEIVTQIIVKALKKLNDEAKLKLEHMSVYEKFVEQKE